jgi:cytochrome c2
MKTGKLIITFSIIIISAASGFYGFESNIFHFQENQKVKTDLPQNPLDGRIVFESYGCINCHSINGFGGKTAPDFNSKNFLSGEFDLISEMWNHSPKMLKMLEQMDIIQKKMSAHDFASLRYFIYFLGYISNNGSVSKGQELFTQMKCVGCHSIGKSIPDKINLDKTGYYASPIYLAQVMWNHAAQMHKKQKSTNIDMPLFKDDEFADLAAYLEAESILGKRNKNLMYPGNPVKGEKLFESKNCLYCHSQNAIGPSLSNIDLHKNVNEIAGMLWNHSNVMESAMSKNKISWPLFKNDEMGNLLAYLYFYNNTKVAGSIENGQKLLAIKGCLNCHSNGNSDNTIAASEIKPFDNIDEFFSKLWDHMPLIEKDFYAKGKEVPRLLPEDVKSLYLYFNRTQR